VYVHFDSKVLWRCLTGRQHDLKSARCGIRVVSRLSWAFSRMSWCKSFDIPQRRAFQALRRQL
jgi:hypothetical protein